MNSKQSAQTTSLVCHIYFWFIYLVLAIAITSFMLWNVPFNGFKATLISDSVAGNADRPYVYRALLPALLRALESILPSSLQELVLNFAQQQPFLLAVERKQNIESHAIGAFLGLIVTTFSCFLVYFATLHALINHFYPQLSRHWALALFFGTILTCLFTQTHSFLIYDPGTLAFSALLLLFLAQRKWYLFFPIFALGTMNKETTILLVPLLYFSRPPKTALVTSAAFVIWAVLFLLIRWQFRDNSGSSLEVHLIDQWQRVTFDELIYLGTLTALCFAFSAKDWYSKPILLRQFVFICALPLLVFLFFFGIVYEIRVFHELVPAIYLLSFPTLIDLYKRFVRRNIKSAPLSTSTT